jgi:hypothetical protein
MSSFTQNPVVAAADYVPATDVLYSKPKVNSSGGKSVGILNKNTMKSTYLSTPLMLTWGCNENDFDGSGKFSYDLSLQFPSDEWASPATSSFLNAMVEFEAKIKADAIVNAKDWFNKPKMSPEVVDALFTPMLRYPKDKETGESDRSRAPTLRIKIPFWEGDFKTELYDPTGVALYPGDSGETPMTLIPKGVNIAAVIQCGGIWFANGKFGVTWRLFQAAVKPKATLRGKCLINLSSEDTDKLNETTPAETAAAETAAAEEDSCEIVEDSAEEEEEEEEEVIAPIVVEAKKKVVRRAKKPVAAAAGA